MGGDEPDLLSQEQLWTGYLTRSSNERQARGCLFTGGAVLGGLRRRLWPTRGLWRWHERRPHHGKSQTAASALNNGTACASDSLNCTKDACNGAGTCLHSVVANYCVIGGKCWAKGQGSCK